MDMDNDQWLTFEEAGRMLERSPSTLQVQRRLGSFRAQKRNGTWVTRPEWVEQYRKEHLGHKGWAVRMQKQAMQKQAEAKSGDK